MILRGSGSPGFLLCCCLGLDYFLFLSGGGAGNGSPITFLVSGCQLSCIF